MPDAPANFAAIFANAVVNRRATLLETRAQLRAKNRLAVQAQNIITPEPLAAYIWY